MLAGASGAGLGLIAGSPPRSASCAGDHPRFFPSGALFAAARATPAAVSGPRMVPGDGRRDLLRLGVTIIEPLFWVSQPRKMVGTAPVKVARLGHEANP